VTLTYSLTLNNNENVSDTYSLSATDNAGWSLSVSPTSRVMAARSSDNTTTLSVTISENAIGGPVDNITVTATSQTNNAVSASGSCTAQAAIIINVSLSISPSENIGLNGSMLNYIVTVLNTGNVSDNYALSISDDVSPSWAPSLSPISLSVAAGDSDDSTLTVTVPSNAVGGAIDDITVIATSQTDNMVNGSASCTAQVTIARSVSVSIYPISQSGASGAALTYTVTLNNTGIIDDNYSLIVTDNASPSWNFSVSPSSLSVSAGRSGNATLTVVIPGGTISGTIDEITVIVDSQTDASVSASATCTATAMYRQGISPWVYVGAIVIIVVIIAAVLIMERTRRKLHAGGSQPAHQNAGKLTK
jgi:hypothetical protein